jgi:hypothetical protein
MTTGTHAFLTRVTLAIADDPDPHVWVFGSNDALSGEPISDNPIRTGRYLLAPAVTARAADLAIEVRVAIVDADGRETVANYRGGLSLASLAHGEHRVELALGATLAGIPFEPSPIAASTAVAGTVADDDRGAPIPAAAPTERVTMEQGGGGSKFPGWSAMVSDPPGRVPFLVRRRRLPIIADGYGAAHDLQDVEVHYDLARDRWFVACAIADDLVSIAWRAGDGPHREVCVPAAYDRYDEAAGFGSMQILPDGRAIVVGAPQLWLVDPETATVSLLRDRDVDAAPPTVTQMPDGRYRVWSADGATYVELP